MSREMDVLVAEKVMGWQVIRRADGTRTLFAPSIDPLGAHWMRHECAPPEWGGVPYYSTDIDAAWRVVEHLTTAHKTFHLWCSPVDGEWHADTDADDGSDKPIGAWADTAPLAICRAALMAVGATPPAL